VTDEKDIYYRLEIFISPTYVQAFSLNWVNSNFSYHPGVENKFAATFFRLPEDSGI
jgi:hypothetical protein